MGVNEAELANRIDEWRDELTVALVGLYGSTDTTDRLIDLATTSHATRAPSLIERDRVRSLRPGWFQEPARVGYMAYVDRFGGDLSGVRGRVPYLRELGVDVLHLLSLFAARRGENDGGYAIRDYLVPDPAVGTESDLDALISDLHANEISLCVDFVLNHTSDDHDWARQALAGSEYHRDLYIMLDNESETQRYEATLPEVFPNLAPGNFTRRDEIDRWVWTTFREFQWDLNWANPDVIVEVGALALALANLGIDVLRLDAIAFTWKRLGTNCQNQPEAHLIAQALRALLAIAAPATVLLAEAIVGPDDLVGYLGRHHLERRECQIAYHNQLMVQSWSMLATGETNLARVALNRLPDAPSETTWFTYVRCHDDIGWAIDDADGLAAGVSGAGHRHFLAAFYRGDFPMSFASGLPFGVNDETGDERTSGMTATLAGVAAALSADDDVALDLGIRRMLLLYGIAFGYGGIPIVYMGDEVCLGDDLTFLDDPDRADDTRWAHRPRLDDASIEQRNVPGTNAERLWSGIRRLVEARRTCRPLHGAGSTRCFDTGTSAVFGWRRRHPLFGDMVGLANLGLTTAVVDLSRSGPDVPHQRFVDRLDAGGVDVATVGPLQVRWLAVPEASSIMPVPPQTR